MWSWAPFSKALREREIKSDESRNARKSRSRDRESLRVQVLNATLDALHSYLLHADPELFRLRDDSESSRSRFSSAKAKNTSKLQHYDNKETEAKDDDTNTEMDGFFDYVTSNAASEDHASSIIAWARDNEYDSDSIYEDLDHGKKKSNFYHDLKGKGTSSLYELLERKYVVARQHSVSKINFGINILLWLAAGDKQHFTNFEEEMVRNTYSTIDEGLFDEYTEECRIKKNNYRKERWTLNELLSLKCYTDTNDYQAAFRKAFWSTSKLSYKKQFFWWALTLYQTMLYHARPIPRASGTKDKPMTLFHGLNDVFIINDKVRRLHHQ